MEPFMFCETAEQFSEVVCHFTLLPGGDAFQLPPILSVLGVVIVLNLAFPVGVWRCFT